MQETVNHYIKEEQDWLTTGVNPTKRARNRRSNLNTQKLCIQVVAADVGCSKK